MWFMSVWSELKGSDESSSIRRSSFVRSTLVENIWTERKPRRSRPHSIPADAARIVAARGFA